MQLCPAPLAAPVFCRVAAVIFALFSMFHLWISSFPAEMSGIMLNPRDAFRSGWNRELKNQISLQLREKKETGNAKRFLDLQGRPGEFFFIFGKGNEILKNSIERGFCCGLCSLQAHLGFSFSSTPDFCSFLSLFLKGGGKTVRSGNNNEESKGNKEKRWMTPKKITNQVRKGGNFLDSGRTQPQLHLFQAQKVQPGAKEQKNSLQLGEEEHSRSSSCQGFPVPAFRARGGLLVA